MHCVVVVVTPIDTTTILHSQEGHATVVVTLLDHGADGQIKKYCTEILWEICGITVEIVSSNHDISSSFMHRLFVNLTHTTSC